MSDHATGVAATLATHCRAFSSHEDISAPGSEEPRYIDGPVPPLNSSSYAPVKVSRQLRARRATSELLAKATGTLAHPIGLSHVFANSFAKSSLPTWLAEVIRAVGKCFITVPGLKPISVVTRFW